MTKTIYVCHVRWYEGGHYHHVTLRSFTTQAGAEDYCEMKSRMRTAEDEAQRTAYYWEKLSLHTGKF